MKTYRIFECIDSVLAYDVRANSPEEAVSKLELSLFTENPDITRASEGDKEIRREAEWDGQEGW